MSERPGTEIQQNESLTEAFDSKKRELGQFLTPRAIASFMASLFESFPAEVKLLDPGAGDGALTAAFVRNACDAEMRPKRISVTAYELDPVIIPRLEQTLRKCQAECIEKGIDFVWIVHNKDFVEAGCELVSSTLFSDSVSPFNACIINPPYRKISSDSRTRWLLRKAEIETTNLYTGFLALSAKLLADSGEMVAICPRSFCNGPYFKHFREQFLSAMSLRRLHVFESRAAAFQTDDVLQENVVVHAVKSGDKPPAITTSISYGRPESPVFERSVRYHDVISPSDSDHFIHLITEYADDVVRDKIARCATPLTTLGLEVSTGRVVDFRASEFLLTEARTDAAPLIYPAHFDGTFVRWPAQTTRKPNAIRITPQTSNLLVPASVYVLVKRFTSKEERRRVVACIYDPSRVAAENVGFENHLNYFHSGNRGISMRVAKGLAMFLNSTLVDRFFRQFNGHTQVNATDLRNLRYPTLEKLTALGLKIDDAFPAQPELDALVERELL